MGSFLLIFSRQKLRSKVVLSELLLFQSRLIFQTEFTQSGTRPFDLLDLLDIFLLLFLSNIFMTNSFSSQNVHLLIDPLLGFSDFLVPLFFAKRIILSSSMFFDNISLFSEISNGTFSIGRQPLIGGFIINQLLFSLLFDTSRISKSLPFTFDWFRRSFPKPWEKNSALRQFNNIRVGVVINQLMLQFSLLGLFVLLNFQLVNLSNDISKIIISPLNCILVIANWIGVVNSQ